MACHWYYNARVQISKHCTCSNSLSAWDCQFLLNLISLIIYRYFKKLHVTVLQILLWNMFLWLDFMLEVFECIIVELEHVRILLFGWHAWAWRWNRKCINSESQLCLEDVYGTVTNNNKKRNIVEVERKMHACIKWCHIVLRLGRWRLWMWIMWWELHMLNWSFLFVWATAL